MGTRTVTCFTDPLCPWSWGAEPQVRRVQEEFGDGVAFTFVLVGLERELDATRARGKLAATLEMAARTGQSSDPRVWRTNPPGSSFPACQAAKAAGEQGLEAPYLRALREALFLEAKAIDTPEELEELAADVPGLDAERFAADLRSRAVAERFAADHERARPGGERMSIPAYEIDGNLVESTELRDALVAAGAEPRPLPEPPAALERWGRMTTAEIAAVCGLPFADTAAELWRLARDDRVVVTRHVCGESWALG